jgi:hypothetical protein
VTALPGLDSEAAATVVSAVLACTLAVLSLDAPRWDARFGPRLDERDRLQALLKAHYAARPRLPLYAFVADLALQRKLRGRLQRLTERAAKAESLPEERYGEGCLLARQWIETVGEFARCAAVEEALPLRRFMQTYHLGVIREGWLALPFVVCLAANGQLDDAATERAIWGLALLDSAARYNGLAPHQRQAVYFLDVAGLGPVGPVVRTPARWKEPLLTLHNRLVPAMRLRRFHFYLASRRLQMAADRLTSRRAAPA